MRSPLTAAAIRRHYDRRARREQFVVVDHQYGSRPAEPRVWPAVAALILAAGSAASVAAYWLTLTLWVR